MKALLAALLVLAASCAVTRHLGSPPSHRFEIGEHDFLFDGAPLVIRSGEMHAARIPREYWQQRLEMVRAMGCNTVCAYLFWNQHEPREGEFDFSGQADVAEYCRLAQRAGLHVILRPGPYACAEWEFGGFPWWLLKTPDIKLRTRDPRYMAAVKSYLTRVGRELAPLQASHGGPIMMVQVENEYGSYGDDKEYIKDVRDILRGAGFDVPLFTCDGPSQLPRDTQSDIFSVVNFGGDPLGSFAALRKVRPSGPLMCGEYYPGWFDSWGKPHHRGATKNVVDDLSSMLANGQSFSIYMVHGGTSFGFSAGANCGAHGTEFAPQSTSYDYDAPIDEAGRPTPKFYALRNVFQRWLAPGELLPEPPSPTAIIELPSVRLTECASLFDQLGTAHTDEHPRAMEQYDQAQGCILYRTTLPAGGAGKLTVSDAHDIAQVWLDRSRVGTLDRRFQETSLALEKRDAPRQLDIFVETFGRVNYGSELHDRKGITQKVQLTLSNPPPAVTPKDAKLEIKEVVTTRELTGFQVFSLPFDAKHLASLHYEPCSSPRGTPAMYRGHFDLDHTGDTFLDTRGWSRGAVWINGHALGRYWSIGPQATLYLPGCWLKHGTNELVVLDIDGGAGKLDMRGLRAPILDVTARDEKATRAHRKTGQTLKLDGLTPIAQGNFAAGAGVQSATLPATKARYVCFEARSALNTEQPWTTIAEFELFGADGNALSRAAWKIVYADSEELDSENGSAANAIDGKPDTIWHTQWSGAAPKHPHQIVIDLGSEQSFAGLRCLPRQVGSNGRIRDWALYASDKPFAGL